MLAYIIVWLLRTGLLTFCPLRSTSKLLSYLRLVVRLVLEVKTTLSLLLAYSSMKYFSPTNVSFHNGIEELVALVELITGGTLEPVVVVVFGGIGGT
jgi:hypothetical protein